MAFVDRSAMDEKLELARLGLAEGAHERAERVNRKYFLALLQLSAILPVRTGAGMDCGEFEEEREMLRSIAAMLLGLAALAQLLCILPLALRALLLPALRHAEAVARAFAVERTSGALNLPGASIGAADGDGCAEVLYLARCFRALASIFSFFENSQDFDGRPPFRGGPNERLAQGASAIMWRDHLVKGGARMASCAAGSFDTS